MAKPVTNLPRRSITSNRYNQTGRAVDALTNFDKVANELSYQENKPNFVRQQVVKVQLNAPAPANSITSIISSFFGNEQDNQGAILYHYSEDSNPCEPAPEDYENLPNKELFKEAFCVKSYIKSSETISNLKPNDIVVGQYSSNNLFDDFIILDNIGTIAQTVQNFQSAISAFANGVPISDPASIAETTDCSASAGSDFAYFAQPCTSKITSTYGMRQRPAGPNKGTLRMHHGIDMAGPVKTPIYAAYDGKVIFENKTLLDNQDQNVMGRIELSHNIVNGLPDKKVSTVGKTDGNTTSTETTLISGTYKTRYLHMLQILVTNGTQVTTGQLIGYMSGQDEPYSVGTGREDGVPISTGPHLHFEIIHPNGQSIDPIQVFGWGKNTKGNSRCTTPEIEANRKARELAAKQEDAAKTANNQTAEQKATSIADKFANGNYESALADVAAVQKEYATKAANVGKKVGDYLGF